MSSAARAEALRGQIGRFLLVGVANTAIGLSVIYGCMYFLGLGDVLANVAGYACGLAASFVLNSRWTFRYDGRMPRAAARFAATFLLAYGANLAVVLAAIRDVGIDAYVAQAVGVCVYTVVFFSLCRVFVFAAIDSVADGRAS
jgi:putative flippase GtrA